MFHIHDLQDYARAAALLDEMTAGHAQLGHNMQVLIELEDAIISYEKECSQLRAFHIRIDARTTPVQLLNDIIDTLQLSTSDLPEIGSMTVVSDVLEGKKTISCEVALDLAQRFSVGPEWFLPKAS